MSKHRITLNDRFDLSRETGHESAPRLPHGHLPYL